MIPNHKGIKALYPKTRDKTYYIAKATKLEDLV